VAEEIDRPAIEAMYAVIRPYVRVTPVVELEGAVIEDLEVRHDSHGTRDRAA
jgi:hypothetical protein